MLLVWRLYSFRLFKLFYSTIPPGALKCQGIGITTYNLSYDRRRIRIIWTSSAEDWPLADAFTCPASSSKLLKSRQCHLRKWSVPRWHRYYLLFSFGSGPFGELSGRWFLIGERSWCLPFPLFRTGSTIIIVRVVIVIINNINSININNINIIGRNIW